MAQAAGKTGNGVDELAGEHHLKHRSIISSPASNIDRVFHALGDPTRRKIVEKLSEGPISVAKLAEPFGITLAAIVQHLQLLEESGLVRTAKTGRVRTCSVEPAGLSVAAQWVAERRLIWERRLDRLGDLPSESE